MKPEISVIIPTRNRRHLVQTTLRCALLQQDVRLEVILVDDGSTDGTASAATSIQDPRLRLIRHTHPLGVSTARNHGASQARGPWLAFCDDDDVWAPDKLARQLDAASCSQRTWSYAGAVRVDGTLRIIGGAPPPAPEQLARRLPGWNVMPGGSSNVLVRADTFSAAGRWDPTLVNLADWDLWVRLAREGLPACVPAPLVGYRIHQGNASADTALVLREARLLDGRFGATLDYGELHHYLGWVSVRCGRRAAALAHFARAAARGQLRSASTAAWALAERWLARRLPIPPRGSEAPHDGWIAEAERWIAPLRAPTPGARTWP